MPFFPPAPKKVSKNKNADVTILTFNLVKDNQKTNEGYFDHSIPPIRVFKITEKIAGQKRGHYLAIQHNETEIKFITKK